MNTSLATAAPSSPVIDPDAAAPVLPPVVTPPTTPTPRDRIRARGLDRYVSGHGVDLLDVAKVDTPAATETFSPVPHHEMYDHVQSELKRVGIRETETFHALWRGGDRYIGLAITDLDPGLDGREVVVGWFNSHDHSHAATFLLGEQVTVCFNLCLHAEIKVSRKHTRHIRRDLPGLIGEAVGRIEDQVKRHAERADRYLETDLEEASGAHLLVRLLDEGAFSRGTLHRVLDEWRHPSQKEWATDWNVNRLYQAVTVQPTPLHAMGRRHRALHFVLDDFVERKAKLARQLAEFGASFASLEADLGLPDESDDVV
jgi:hypothetical protein